MVKNFGKRVLLLIVYTVNWWLREFDDIDDEEDILSSIELEFEAPQD
jgi:hypothetical protein